MKYPKIQTLWKRDENGKIIKGEFSKDEFSLVDNWFVTEKLHGQNCRILVNFDEGNVKGKFYEHNGLFIQGRTNKAELDDEVLERLKKKLNAKKIKEQINGQGVLYGELVGDKIQKNGWKYVRKEDEEPDNEFVMFDSYINGWWLEWTSITDIADNVGLKHTPCLFATTDKKQIIDFIKEKPDSQFSEEKLVMEGIVARTSPMLLFRNGKPLMFKLKVSDVVY
ncbi:MAG: RNA ligase family protein [Promethearchaeota archaeon]